MQSWPLPVALKDGELLAQCGIFQRDLPVSTKNQEKEANADHNCVQHEVLTVPSSGRKNQSLDAREILAKDRALSDSVRQQFFASSSARVVHRRPFCKDGPV